MKPFVALVTFMGLIQQLSASECHGVFCVKEIDDQCGGKGKEHDVCATLYLRDTSGNMTVLQGNGNIQEIEGGKIGVKDIIEAKVVGTFGCYTLFKGKEQRTDQEHIKIRELGTNFTLKDLDVETTRFR